MTRRPTCRWGGVAGFRLGGRQNPCVCGGCLTRRVSSCGGSPREGPVRRSGCGGRWSCSPPPAATDAPTGQDVEGVDGGPRAHGDESDLGTPVEDITSLAAVAPLDVPVKLVISLGFGIDAYDDVNHVQGLEVPGMTRSRVVISWQDDFVVRRQIRTRAERMLGYARVLEARNPATSADRLRALADDDVRPVRVWVARNFNTPRDALARLAQDPDEAVRWCALVRPYSSRDRAALACQRRASAHGRTVQQLPARHGPSSGRPTRSPRRTARGRPLSAAVPAPTQRHHERDRHAMSHCRDERVA